MPRIYCGLPGIKKNKGLCLRHSKSGHTITWLLFCFLTVSLFLAGCAPSGRLAASLGKQFSLAINQTAVISSENLTIKLVDISDSRCPTGATCIWAGEAKAEILIGTDNLTLVEPGHSADNTQAYKNYLIKFEVTPYPSVNKTIEKSDYRLVLTVKKNIE